VSTFKKRLVKVTYSKRQTTNNLVIRKVLANLCNFAYDPRNFDHLRALNVIPDLFLDCLTEPDSLIIRFAIGGICNSCVDPTNAKAFLDNGLADELIKHLSTEDLETLQNTLACFALLFDHRTLESNDLQSYVEAFTPRVKQCIEQYANSDLLQTKNLASLILQNLQTIVKQTELEPEPNVPSSNVEEETKQE
jgi:armadillo repeat-containing protein 7